MDQLSSTQKFCTRFLPEHRDTVLQKAGSTALCVAPALIPLAVWKAVTKLPFNPSNLAFFVRSPYFTGGLLAHAVVIGGVREVGLKALASRAQTPPPSPSVDEEAVKRRTEELKQDAQFTDKVAKELREQPEYRELIAGQLKSDPEFRGEVKGELREDPELRGEAKGELRRDHQLLMGALTAAVQNSPDFKAVVTDTLGRQLPQ